MTTRGVPSSVRALKQLLFDAVLHEVRSWGVAQGEAARRLGTDRAALNKFLQGRRMPSLEALLSYADAADITFHFALEGYPGAMPARRQGSIIINGQGETNKSSFTALSQQFK